MANQRHESEPSPPAWELARELRLSGRPVDALRILRHELKEKSHDYRLHDELGSTLVELGRLEEAIGSFLTAFHLKPDFSEVCHKIGSALATRGILEPAAEWFARARTMNPTETSYLCAYGRILVALNRRTLAAEVFDHWIKTDPTNPMAPHLSNAALGLQHETKVPSEYIRALFDRCANRFDEYLAKLKYSGPDLLLEALQPVFRGSDSKWDILDAGCGTGLAGAQLRPFARRLVGVDLSARMLDEARRRNIYDELVEADMLDYLFDQPNQFDIVVAADVLPYFGDLTKLFSRAARVLRRSGVIAVLLEELVDESNYRLNPSGRFSHSRHYLNQVMEESSFAVRQLGQVSMRREENRPVPTLVAVATVNTPDKDF